LLTLFSLFFFFFFFQGGTPVEFAVIAEITPDQAKTLSGNVVSIAAPKQVQAAAALFFNTLIPSSSMQVIVASSTFSASGYSFVRGVSVRVGVLPATPSLLANSVASLLTTSTSSAASTPLSAIAYYPLETPGSGYMQVGVRGAILPISSSSQVPMTVNTIMLGVNNLGASPSAALAIFGSVGQKDDAWLSFGAQANITGSSLLLKFEAAEVSIPKVQNFLTIKSVTGNVAMDVSSANGVNYATVSSVAVTGKVRSQRVSIFDSLEIYKKKGEKKKPGKEMLTDGYVHFTLRRLLSSSRVAM
jgi:hypothetical protein